MPTEEQGTGLSLNSGASINVPMWNGTPKECGEVWTLRKGERVASCHLWTHPLGGEVRLTVDGLWCRGETHRDGRALIDAALEFRKQSETKGVVIGAVCISLPLADSSGSASRQRVTSSLALSRVGCAGQYLVQQATPARPNGSL